jgi:hypothetical protein
MDRGARIPQSIVQSHLDNLAVILSSCREEHDMQFLSGGCLPGQGYFLWYGRLLFHEADVEDNPDYAGD